jgi:hypothetical protein
MTEIAKVDASAAVIMSVNNSLVCRFEKYCNEEQKMKYLVPLARGRYRCFVYQSQKRDLMQHLKKQQRLIKRLLFVKRDKKLLMVLLLHYIVIAQTDVEKDTKELMPL